MKMRSRLDESLCVTAIEKGLTGKTGLVPDYSQVCSSSSGQVIVESSERKVMATDSDLPLGFTIITPGTFSVYQQWLSKALSDPTVRRFMSNSGWLQVLDKAPETDWDKVVMVSEKTCIQMNFDRSAVMEISMALYTVGDAKELSSGRALAAILWALNRYRYFRRVRSGCKECNVASLRLHRHIFGEPWGIEPLGVWDEVEGFVNLVHFSSSLPDLLTRFKHLLRPNQAQSEKTEEMEMATV